MTVQRKRKDWATIISLLFMALLVAGASFLTWRLYDTYSSAFLGKITPTKLADGTKGPAASEQQISDARAAWGQLGDYFGGVLNPVFGFVSVMALLLTIVYQSRELKMSRDELSKSAEALGAQNKAIEQQRFEQTFFAWLGTYREIVSSLSASGLRVEGRSVFFLWWQDYLSAPRIHNDVIKHFSQEVYPVMHVPDLDAERRIRSLPESTHHFIVDAVDWRWETLYKKHESELDSLFRVLYRLILWIDSQPTGRLSNAEKWLYVSIVRSQLSWLELVYLFYNGQTSRGEKFRALVNKYALLDNLTLGSDPILDAYRANPPGNRGYAPSAYSSIAARKAMGLPDTNEETLALAAGAAASSGQST